MIRVELTKGCLDIMMSVADFEAHMQKTKANGSDSLEFFYEMPEQPLQVFKRINVPITSVVAWYRYTHTMDYAHENKPNGNVYRIIGWED